MHYARCMVHKIIIYRIIFNDDNDKQQHQHARAWTCHTAWRFCFCVMLFGVWSCHTHTHTHKRTICRVWRVIAFGFGWIMLCTFHIKITIPPACEGHYTISELWPFLATAANTVYPQLASAVFLANTRTLTQGVTQPQSHTHTCTTTTH